MSCTQGSAHKALTSAALFTLNPLTTRLQMHLPTLVLIDEVAVIHVSGFYCCSVVVLLFM